MNAKAPIMRRKIPKIPDIARTYFFSLSIAIIPTRSKLPIEPESLTEYFLPLPV
jgi:hypothetical protein